MPTIEELEERIKRLEAKEFATGVFLAQVAAYLPAPDILLSQLTEDVGRETLFSGFPDEFREHVVDNLLRIYALLLDLRRKQAQDELKRLPPS